MERGDALAVLSIITVVGMLATITIATLTPAGNLVQGEPAYPLVSGVVPCERGNPALLIHQTPRTNVYCCPEDMIGQNTCREPHTLYN